MILVTGASGRIGSAVIRHLHERAVPVRAIGRRHAQAAMPDTDIEWVYSELASQHAIVDAMHGIDTVVLHSSASPDHIRAQEGVVAAAQAGGVQRIVKLSTIGAAADAACDAARSHWRVEQRLADSGLDHCIVRATRTMQDLLHQVPLLLTGGLLAGCQGDGQTADVDARDIGRVLATLAGARRAEGSAEVDGVTLQVTGPRAMSFAEMAAALSHALGRPVRYVDCTPADLLRCAEAAGVESWRAHDMVTWQTEAREGRHSIVYDTVEHITGHAPRRFETFANELAASLRYANAPERTMVAAGGIS